MPPDAAELPRLETPNAAEVEGEEEEPNGESGPLLAPPEEAGTGSWTEGNPENLRRAGYGLVGQGS